MVSSALHLYSPGPAHTKVSTVATRMYSSATKSWYQGLATRSLTACS